MRTRPPALRAASPRRSPPSSGSSSHRTPSSASSSAIAGHPRVEAGRRVAGHPPGRVEVDHQLEPVAHGGPGRADGLEPVRRPVGVDPDLHRPEALVADPDARTPLVRRRDARPSRHTPGARPSPRRTGPRRAAGDLADEVPERGLERPVAAGVEGDRLERPDVARDAQRVLAEEQVLVRREAVHRVARADARDALVGLDPDERRRERRPRDGVPGREERRVERSLEPRDADPGDAH